MEFSRCTRTRRPPHEKRRRDVFEERTGGRSLKTQQRTGSSPTHVEVDVDLGELEWPDDEPQERRVIDGSSSHRSKSSGIPKGGDPAAASATATLLRLHPNHQPYLRRLPPLRVSPPASGIADFRGVTGGVYKARERIHRDVADSRLLATPPSWRRIAASNPNRDRLFGIRSTSRYRNPLYRPM